MSQTLYFVNKTILRHVGSIPNRDTKEIHFKQLKVYEHNTVFKRLWSGILKEINQFPHLRIQFSRMQTFSPSKSS